ncbi:helix-turn-helix domain-containing protein [Halobacillus litoralis]|uniref:Helix-turn-helix domain-containing protein n=1 Tax=Halobacillus litoralis TaxID=45668 RepID=A0A845F967_9BACI|nr:MULTISPECIES: helix-turn-helix transcriptional regulator [Halobacillus]MEC3882479.1 helix-turn-helix transcriptional regulator [Halobacillus sp. HZG1]MYL70187.1 helix-turn-helix domain-containing protein [Halobacillus litoralis]
MSTGNNIRKYRELKNFTKEELAMKARIGVHTLESYETDERIPELDTILKISTVLDIPASELLENHEENSSEMDEELISLIQEIGVKRSKLLLKKARDFSEQDVLHAMNLLYDLNQQKN